MDLFNKPYGAQKPAYTPVSYEILQEPMPPSQPLFRHGKPASMKRILPGLLVVAFYLVLSFGGVVWLAVDIFKEYDGDFTHPIDIGGSFLITAAKIIDLVYSALIAPIIVAVINFYMFNMARICIVGGRQDKPTSLEVLIEASTTDKGSYSPFKHINLLKRANIRFLLLSIIALNSAISYSSLSNVIGYEAYDVKNSTENVTLDYLYTSEGLMAVTNTASESLEMVHDEGLFSQFNKLNISSMQEAYVSTELFQSVGQLSGHHVQRLQQGAYTNVNVSEYSLRQLEAEFHTLYNIPMINLTYKCEPSRIHGVSMSGIYDVQININASTTSNKKVREYVGGIRNLKPFLQGSYFQRYNISRVQPLVAFSSGGEIWLGLFEPKMWNNMEYEVTSMPSPFGNVSKFTHSNVLYLNDSASRINMKPSDLAANDMQILNFFGISCAIYQRKVAGIIGKSGIYRTSGSSEWFVRTIKPEKAAQPEVHIPMLRDLQTFPIFSQAIIQDIRGGPFPGLGAAMTQPQGTWKKQVSKSDNDSIPNTGLGGVDFGKYVDAFLYLEGESTRLIYDTVQNGTKKYSVPSFTAIAERTGAQLYHMTFLPFALLAGLLSMFLATATTVGLALLSIKNDAFRHARVLNPLRVAMDLGRALDEQEFEQSRERNTDWLEKWAKKRMLGYEDWDGVLRLRRHEASDRGRTKAQFLLG